jgi:hypothetical protein
MKSIIIFLFFFISGCSNPKPLVYPETHELASATINEFYHQNIEIKGGPVNETSVSVRFIPTDSGLMWAPEETKYNLGGSEEVNKDYHRIIVSGIPKKAGNYSVIVSGFTLGTMYPGRDFYRKYTIKIKQ